MQLNLDKPTTSPLPTQTCQAKTSFGKSQSDQVQFGMTYKIVLTEEEAAKRKKQGRRALLSLLPVNLAALIVGILSLNLPPDQLVNTLIAAGIPTAIVDTVVPLAAREYLQSKTGQHVDDPESE